MALVIEFSEDAEAHLAEFSARERKIVLDAIEANLAWEPSVASKNRKLLRTNPLASWELRVGLFRVFYNVSATTVVIVAVGRKSHNKLFLAGRKYRL